MATLEYAQVRFMEFVVTRPLWFAALAVLPLLVYYWRRSLVRLPQHQRARSLRARIALVILAVTAMAGPQITRYVNPEQIVVVVDDTPSVAPSASQQIEPIVSELQRSGMVRQVLSMSEMFSDRNKTDLAAAIATARASIPADRLGRIVLFSDGNQTEGDAVAAARAAGVPIHTIGLNGPEMEVFVSAATAPTKVRPGESFHVEVVIQSTHEDDCTIELLAGPESVDKQTKHIIQGENRFRFARAMAQGPAAMFTARISGCKDTLAENNEASCIVLVGPRPRVLLVENQKVLAQHLAKALGEENVEVEVRTPQDMPNRLEEFRRFELVILSNVSAASLPQARMEALRGYVRDFGGGLIVVGGDQSLTVGNYRGTVLEEALPVISEVKKEKPKPSLAMVLVLDSSGSMKGRSIDLAKQAVRRAVGMLNPRDQVGVLAFEDQSHWVAPLAPATDKPKILQQVNTIVADGGTNMYPAIEQAYLALRDSYGDLKHIILLTDGLPNPGDFDALTKEIAAAGITMSTVGVGDEPARPLLQSIAQQAKGHAYFCRDAAELPRIFEMETRSAGKIGITEEPFFAQVIHAAPALRGLDFAKVPTLLGYVETQAKPGSQVILAAKTGEPLLATWRYGMGTATVFTSDIQSRWAAAWLRWPGFGQFWSQLVRQTMRKDPFENVLLRAEVGGGAIHVTLDAFDRAGKFINNADVSLTEIDPAQKRQQTTLVQVAPGRYGASLPATPGPWCLEAKVTAQGQLVETVQLGVVVPYADEFRIRPSDTALLRAIAETSGGRYNPKPEEVIEPTDRSIPSTTRFWPCLLVAAMFFFLLDLAFRRIARREGEGRD